MDQEFGISRCKWLYIGWINKVLLYSTEKYIQYPVINNDGKEHEKEYMYHFAVQQKLNSIVNYLYFNKINLKVKKSYLPTEE